MCRDVQKIKDELESLLKLINGYDEKYLAEFSHKNDIAFAIKNKLTKINLKADNFILSLLNESNTKERR